VPVAEPEAVPVAEPEAVPVAEPEAVPEPEADTVEQAVEELVDASAAESDKTEKMLTLMLEINGEPFSVDVPAGVTVASACGHFMGGKLPLETDLEGTIVASWRLGDESGPSDGMDPVESLGPCPNLYRVEAKPVMVDVLVKSEPSQRFRTRVSSAVRISSLITGIVSWCDLESGPWVLNNGEVALDGALLVEELPKAGLVLAK
jgi:hypothetical protein